MSRPLIASSSWALALTLGCAPTPEPAQVPAASPSLPKGPAPPEHGLPIVALGDDWSPGRAVAGDLDALREALASTTAARASVEPRLLSAQRSAGLRSALSQLAPTAAWQVEAGSWAESVAGVPSLQREPGPDGAPPRYPREGVSPREAVDTTTVVIADAPVDLTAWRALPAANAGSCQSAFDALALGQEQSLAYVEPFLDHADAVLRARFRAGLGPVLPELRAEVEAFAEPTPPPGAGPAQVRTHACGHALYARVEEAAACMGSKPCALAPRMVLRGGIAVAMPAPSWTPDDCGQRVPIGVEETLQQVATEATVATVSRLEPRWVTLADRVGALGAVYEALDDVCSPRRRRFAEQDLGDARERMDRVQRALGSDALDEAGRWDVESGALFVPGSGPVVSLATFHPAKGGASQTAVAEAKGVRRFLLSRSLCRSGSPELPLAVAVFEPGADAAAFVGFVYEETLLCADLPLPD